MSKENPKICVYAICKNESKFVDRWVNSLKEADYIRVMDTGSTDNTVELFEKYKPLVEVNQRIITPWRFDVARNESLKFVPSDADILVVSDIDQVFRPGWGDILRNAFKEGYEEVSGPIIDYDENNMEEKRFLSYNVHGNTPEWYWERPIHEGLRFKSNREIKRIQIEEFVIEHHPDRTKSRDGYLKLLEMEYQENSKDAYCAIYYGCELSFHGHFKEANDVFLKLLNEANIDEHPEIEWRTCLNIAQYYNEIGEYEKALEYMNRANGLDYKNRCHYVAYADIFMKAKEYNNALYYLNKAATVEYHDASWLENDDLFTGDLWHKFAEIYRDIGEYETSVCFASMSLGETTDRKREYYESYLKEIIEDYQKSFVE